LLHRAKLDKNTGLKNYCEALEKVVVETVEGGKYTKDLAISVTGNNK
jgi:isocitrate dehydrogenase